jgi:O-antigen/teichoic acid export membrane protein
VLAWQGFGLLSFAYSVLARAFVGVILIYSVSFWIPSIGFSRESAKHLLSFGVPFQSMSFLALIKDEFVNLFLGKVVGFEALGFIGWAKKWAESPLRIIMDNVSRVIFPVFARFQKDKDKQKDLIEKLLRYQTLIMFPATIGLIIVMPLLVEIIPKYQKWRSALPIFYIFAASGFLSSYSTPFINFFNGIGKVKISFGFMLLWTGLTWVLIAPLTHLFGMYGFPMLVLVLSSTSILVIHLARKQVQFGVFKHISPFIIAGTVMGILLSVVSKYLGVHNYIGIMILVLLGMTTYTGLLKVVFKINIITEALHIIRKQ